MLEVERRGEAKGPKILMPHAKEVGHGRTRQRAPELRAVCFVSTQWRSSVDLTPFLKEIGRGPEGARNLSRSEAEQVFGAVLDAAVSDLQLGALLIGLRMKGEAVEELVGFAAATEARYEHLAPLPDGRIPVILPSYNGARHMPNLVPLLANLLLEAEVPVLVHGVRRDPKRVTTCEILEALGVTPVGSAAEAHAALVREGIAFLPIEHLHPKLAGVLGFRERLGLRNSAHTLAKILQPIEGECLRLVSVTHPEYLLRMRDFFAERGGSALLLRGAEGEVVANAKRQPQIELLRGNDAVVVVEADASVLAEPPDLPAARDAQTTADWTTAALAGTVAVPAPIERQVAACVEALEMLRHSPRKRR